MSGAPLPCAALTIAVVISGTGDKHYFPSNSLIMSVLPHGWLSKAIPQPLTPAEGLCVQGEIYRVDVCLCLPMCVCLSVYVCVHVQRGQRMSYTLALSQNTVPFPSFYLHTLPAFYLFSLKPLS